MPKRKDQQRFESRCRDVAATIKAAPDRKKHGISYALCDCQTASALHNYLLNREHGAVCVDRHIMDACGCTCGLSAAMLEAGITREEYEEHQRLMFRLAATERPPRFWEPAKRERG